MSDFLGRVTEEQDIFKKILGKIPGFSGYFDRQNRRAADQLLRQVVADRFEEQWQRLSGLQRDLISQGEIASVDDLEAAAIKLRQFVDRVRTAAYGYAGFFDAIKINQEELAQLYQYDLSLLESVDAVKNAIDNVETSVGSDGLPAAIRNLVSVAQQSVEAFNRRSEVIMGPAAAQ
ncbi:MAG: hypothetical protein GYA12_12005 [Chloroflexi bacterium]|nr:hypothetical protein [Chloroflexota bacterium]